MDNSPQFAQVDKTEEILKKTPTKIVRVVSISISVIAVFFLLFSYFAKIDIVVSAQGKVIPSDKSKVIQPLEAGVVKSIKVKDGQAVKAGDILIELDPKMTDAEKEKLQNELWQARVELARLDAMIHRKKILPSIPDVPSDIVLKETLLLTGRLSEQEFKVSALDAEIAKREADLGAIVSTVSQLNQSLPLVRRKYEMREELVKSGYISEAGVIDSKLEFLNTQKELAVQQSRQKESESALRAAKMQKEVTMAEFRSKLAAEAIEAMKKRNTAEKELAKANIRSELQVLKSPIDGIVQQLAVTTVGGVVTQAQALLTVVPKNTTLEVETQVLNKDIGYLKVGQRVVNKVETFDFTRFGYIEGEVSWVGADAVIDQKLGPIYTARIKLKDIKTPNFVSGERGMVTAGMSIISDIKIGERRMIEYFLSPLIKYKQESIRER